MNAQSYRIKLEVDALDLAMKDYKNQLGAYPPCDLTLPSSDNPLLREHIARAFPEYDIAQLDADLPLTGVDTVNFRPDQALVFWLRGFGPDPAHPFVTMGDQQIEKGAVPNLDQKVARAGAFDFDRARLQPVPTPGTVDEDNLQPVVPSYFPSGVAANMRGAPFVYFDWAHYARPASGDVALPAANTWDPAKLGLFVSAGVAEPYFHDANKNRKADASEVWANPSSVQIISSGLDQQFGAPAPLGGSPLRLFPTGVGYDVGGADDDNVTNFANKARLDDAKP